MKQGTTLIPDGVTAGLPAWDVAEPGRPEPFRRAAVPDDESLRHCAWEIGERKAAERYTPPTGHVGLAAVNPAQGFAHWHIRLDWVDRAAERARDAWHHSRPVLRLYDVSYILFNGLNAHRIRDYNLPSLCGHMFFPLPAAGTWQLAEVGFLLRNGEFLPAARSQVVHCPREAAALHSDHAALLVDGDLRTEHVGNVWEHEQILAERSKPRLRAPLRIATFALEALGAGQQTPLARSVSELAAAQAALGHEVHVFVPGSDQFATDRPRDGVLYHPLDVDLGGVCLEIARDFARAARQELDALPPFDLIHLHEWMTGFGAWFAGLPTIFAPRSIETTRLNGSTPTPLSSEIQQAERELARAAGCVLLPSWLRDKAVAELGIDGARAHAFAPEGRLPDEWETPLDTGHAKMEIHVGPLDRLLLFVGPLEHAAGVDLLVEALPVVLQRVPNARLALAGAGDLGGPLQSRAHHTGVAHAVRLLGHVELPQLRKLLRAAEGVVLPSRYRVPFDDAVVDLARRAGRPVITTHGGPAHLVRHEETGLITYDNPGSMVWALDRLLGDPAHAEQMGRNGRQHSGGVTQSWDDVARHYFELCAASFPELTVSRR